MIVDKKGNFRIITVQAYNGCLPITAFMIQRLNERIFLPNEWVNVKGFENYKKAMELFKILTD